MKRRIKIVDVDLFSDRETEKLRIFGGMTRLFQLCVLVVLVLSLPTPSLAQETDARIQEALMLQERVIGGPLFAEILIELDRDGAIYWRANNLKPHRRNDRANSAQEVGWLMQNFSQHGVTDFSDVRPVSGRWWPEHTYAKTSACSERIRIRESAIIDRDALSLVNTLTHERIHSFCFRHKPDTQRRIHNMCDVSYVAGDLAEAVLAHNSQQTERRFIDTSICPALCDALENRGIRMCQEQDYAIVRIFPHDERAFTQGLLFHDGYLYESTGIRGRSQVRRVSAETGQVEEFTRINNRLFGEGLAIWSGELVSLTWQRGIGFTWDIDSLERTGEFSFGGTRRGEGWGLTSDNLSLIMSDGSSMLSFFDPAQLAMGNEIEPYRQLPVSLNSQPLCNLNELEFVDGNIFANVWQSSIIVRIDPETGFVNGIVDLTDIVDNAADEGDVLNGIAHVEGTNRFFITGKSWDSFFELQLDPRPVRADGEELRLKTALPENNFCVD